MPEGETVEATLATSALRARDGETESAEDLLRRLIPDGLRLARAMLLDPDQAEDSVQDACVKAWRKLDRLREGSDPKPWFLGIVANECRSFRRSRWATTVSRVAAPVARRQPSQDQSPITVPEAFAALSREDRLVLVLRYYLDMSADQTARVLHISPGGVRTRAHRAAVRLRELMAAESHEDG
jgi:RNA polymerase sigma-70 factor (ECF subfamily)